MLISEREQMVFDFQRKYGSTPPRLIGVEHSGLGQNEIMSTNTLLQASLELQKLELILGKAAATVTDKTDARLLRAKLMVSELSEVIEAMAQRDEVELADGLADLEYVVVGTAVTYCIPLDAVFHEVHKSNMTKDTVQEAVANHTGNKGKGPDFRPPDIQAVLDLRDGEGERQ